MRSTPGCVLCLLLAACGGGTATPGNPSPSACPAPPPGGPPPPPTQRTDVVTYKNDHSRTGQNLTESVLTPANVNCSSFGLLRLLSVDGKVDAQPLYLSGLAVGGAPHNVVFVATENDSVCAFDALRSGTCLCSAPERAPAGRTAATSWCRSSG